MGHQEVRQVLVPELLYLYPPVPQWPAKLGAHIHPEILQPQGLSADLFYLSSPIMPSHTFHPSRVVPSLPPTQSSTYHSDEPGSHYDCFMPGTLGT